MVTVFHNLWREREEEEGEETRKDQKTTDQKILKWNSCKLKKKKRTTFGTYPFGPQHFGYNNGEGLVESMVISLLWAIWN